MTGPSSGSVPCTCILGRSQGDPVNEWRALTHRNHLDCSSFTNTSPVGNESLEGAVKAGMMGRGRKVEQVLGPS